MIKASTYCVEEITPDEVGLGCTLVAQPQNTGNAAPWWWKLLKSFFFSHHEKFRFEFRIIYMPSLSLNKTLKKRLENSSIFTYLFISKYLYRQNWSLHLCKVLKHKCTFISFCIKMHIRCHSTEGKQGFKVRSSFSDYIFVWLYICRYDMIWEHITC